MEKQFVIYFLVLLFLAGCDKKENSVDKVDNSDNNLNYKVVNSQDQIEQEQTAIVLDVPQRNPDEYVELVDWVREPKQIELFARYTEFSPKIDGIEEDRPWSTVQAVETLDYSSQRPISIKSCHDSQKIYFLVTFPDSDMSTGHKSWIWQSREKVYIEGLDREDALVLKWKTSGGNMSFLPALIETHTADIWFWKACRTNPSGYFDDKSQIVSKDNDGDGLLVESQKYDGLYLYRIADEGKAAYAEKMFFEYKGPALSKYYPTEPKGSRADIAGKGLWADGYWTIEFARDFDTHDSEDVKFSLGNRYEFGISLYEMACTGIEPDWYKPLYRTGNVFDTLFLVIE